jgi:hypothetical protein
MAINMKYAHTELGIRIPLGRSDSIMHGCLIVFFGRLMAEAQHVL